jgi:hypothetical protein
MKVIRIIATILVFVSMAFILACGEEKTASLKGNEAIAAVIQKIPEIYDNPETAMEIYTANAILKRQDSKPGYWEEFTGPKAIGEYKKEKGKSYRKVELSISSIKKEGDKALVEYNLITPVVKGEPWDYKHSCSAEMVKIGQTWKIKMDRVEY